MDITPIYELRNRLRTAMIAGTNLLAEDFRLKRAVEALAPLEKAAPVFAKIGELSRNLIAPGQKDKEGALLDTITLVDAVCCTQGLVDAPGELEPVISGSGTGTILSNVPYSILSPLQEALTSSGSGHYGFVMDCHQEHPELFGDYRVKAAMVQALGASYAELADQVCNWLMEDGEDILPLLMRDFNPKGKKEMVRRLRVIEAISGAKGNGFYIKWLETAEGEVRQNLIYALRHSGENVELLMDLMKQERGNAKKMAYYALACQEDERAGSFFASLYGKKPVEVMEFLYMSGVAWAAPLVVDCVKKLFSTEPVLTGKKKEDGEAAKKLEEQKIAAIDALLCKSGEGINDAILFAAEHAGKSSSQIHKEIVWLICTSLIMHPTEELASLAVSIYEGAGQEGGRHIGYFPAAFLAKLLGAEKSGDITGWLLWLDESLYDKTLTGEKRNTALHPYLSDALSYIQIDINTGKYALQALLHANAADQAYTYTYPLQCDLSGRFTDILMRCDNSKVDEDLARLANLADKGHCAKLEEYFYNQELSSLNGRQYLDALKKCGCTRCKDLLVHYAQSRSRLGIWDLMYYISSMPGTREAKLEEAYRIPELVNNGKIKIQQWDEARYMRMLAQYV